MEIYSKGITHLKTYATGRKWYHGYSKQNYESLIELLVFYNIIFGTICEFCFHDTIPLHSILFSWSSGSIAKKIKSANTKRKWHIYIHRQKEYNWMVEKKRAKWNWKLCAGLKLG